MVEIYKMKIAILGSGQLGKQLFLSLINQYYVNLFAFPEFNICFINQLHNIIKQFDIIINCVANIHADNIQSIEKEDSYNVNYLAVYNLAILCKKYNKKLIHISSDYVYGSNNYEDILSEDYPCNPINQYGLDKYMGQQSIIQLQLNNYLILRVAWLFGKYGNNNFIQKIKRELNTKSQIKVVNDQIGNITATTTVIQVINAYLKNKLPDGIYNVQNNDQIISRYDIACFIKSILNVQCKIFPCKTSDYVLPAKRQLNSNLCTDRIRKYINIDTWKNVIQNYLKLDNTGD